MRRGPQGNAAKPRTDFPLSLSHAVHTPNQPTSCAASYTKLSMSGDALCLTSSLTVGGAIARPAAVLLWSTQNATRISTGFRNFVLDYAVGEYYETAPKQAPQSWGVSLGLFARSSGGEGKDIAPWPFLTSPCAPPGYPNMAAIMARPPFHDQKTGVRYDCNNPDHAGWLRKESAWLKDWRPRFFVLKGSNLFFAKVG